VQCVVGFACLFAVIIVAVTPQKPKPELTPIVVTANPIELPNLVVIDQHQLDCLATNIYHEARGESDMGKLAVAHVTVNRVKSRKFPNTVCDVVYQAQYSEWWAKQGKQVPIKHRCHFSWYCDGISDEIVLTDSNGNIIQKNMKAWQDSNRIARQVLLEKTVDPTNGATHYYNPKLAQPYWRKHYQRVAVVDNHAFYRKSCSEAEH
jgi:spore germination cell wall hydrolase CwlJ-like protein